MVRPEAISSLALLLLLPGFAITQPPRDQSAPTAEVLQQRMEKLLAILAEEQAALKESQLRIDQLRNQVIALQADVAEVRTASPAVSNQQDASDTVAKLASEVNAMREEQDLQQSEIATHEQTKVESASRYPLKLTGIILMNAFANSSAVDIIQSPTVAVPGAGNAGLSLRQTVLGLDARGPRLFGAPSAADVRVDFFGGSDTGGYSNGGGTARFRTAHAELAWRTARAFVEVDHPILNPHAPSSLTAIAQPALAWSGNLWNWIPQAGAEYSVVSGNSKRILVQGALADIPDPPSLHTGTAAFPSPSLAEQSRRPGSEVRLGYAHGDTNSGLQVGLGGYFSPHRNGSDFSFNAWAATFDYRIPITPNLELSGNAFRGSALGGLGAGAFKDYVYHRQGVTESYVPLDDAGGWSQIKARAGERLEFNAAFGLDNAFAHELRPYMTSPSSYYQNLARNATIMSNVIYSPSAYTLFSLEYRRINSSPTSGATSVSDVYGAAVGYRF